MSGQCDPATVATVDHVWARIGQPGKIVRLFHRWGVKRFCMSGKVIRPRLRSLWPDWRGLRFVIATPFWRMGDAQLLDAVAKAFQGHGLELMGPLEICPELARPAGPVGRHGMPAALAADVALGLDAALAHGRADRGQAVVVAGGTVVGRENESHTDAMLAGLGPEAAGGVLVKLPKPQQDLRLDPPTIGTLTVEAAARSGLAGIIVAADSTVIIDPAAVARAADAAGLFVEVLDVAGRWPATEGRTTETAPARRRKSAAEDVSSAPVGAQEAPDR